MDNKKKDNKTKSQLIISVLMLTMIIIAEMYLMVNYNESYIPMLGLGASALIFAYVLADSILKTLEEQEVKRETQYENILRSEKASYIMLKKNFEKIEKQLEALQNNQEMSEEIITAQKAMTKTIIKKTQEEYDKLILSNSEFNTQMDIELQDLGVHMKDIDVELKDLIVHIRDVDCELKDLEAQLKEMELNLNRTIAENTKVVVQAAPAEEISEEIPVIEPVAEVKAAEPEMSDPNKMMSPDDIAALLASMTGEELQLEETVAIENEIAATEEKPPMPDMSDPNKMMSPDDIAALIANL